MKSVTTTMVSQRYRETQSRLRTKPLKVPQRILSKITCQHTGNWCPCTGLFT